MAETARNLPPVSMTAAEFAEWAGDGTGARYELVEGELRAIAPSSATHGIIHANLTVLLHAHLRTNRPGCVVVTAPGIAPRLHAQWNHRIPELGVSCAPVGRGDLLLPDPILLVEVLSPSNKRDTWNNVPLYASLPSVQEILLVDSTVVKAEILRRGEDGQWPENPSTILGPAAFVRLNSIDLDLPLADVFAGTYLTEKS